VHLDGSELLRKIDLSDAGAAAEVLQLDAQADVQFGPEVGKVYGRFRVRHGVSSLSGIEPIGFLCCNRIVAEAEFFCQ
jgi:hypothetical protein